MIAATTIGFPDPDPSNDMRATKDPPCVGCGAHHGSVGEHVKCLEATIRELRANGAADFFEGLGPKEENALRHAGITSLAELRRQVAAMGPSTVGLRGKP